MIAMKSLPFSKRTPVGALLTAVSLLASLAFGTACTVDVEEDPDTVSELGESDQEIHEVVETGAPVGQVTIRNVPLNGDDREQEDEDEGSVTFPGGKHMEPEPDPWTPGKPNPDNMD